MNNFRYSRMAYNEQGWIRPHGGRLGGDDYLGQEGMGHEDWNFSKDIWDDGRYHLYLRGLPAGFENEKFNFVLGTHAKPHPMIVGFIENACFGLSSLSAEIIQRRAKDLFTLSNYESLGPRYAGKSLAQLVKLLKEETAYYKVSVAPHDLHILAQPVPIPPDIYQVKTPRYQALNMTEAVYSTLKTGIFASASASSAGEKTESSFPEGKLVERWHKSRERNQKIVAEARDRFLLTYGRLFCEACAFDPATSFHGMDVHGNIVEAHHDVPLSDPAHGGSSKPSDLKMLCPTCHRAIHRIRPWLRVAEFKAFLDKLKAGKAVSKTT